MTATLPSTTGPATGTVTGTVVPSALVRAIEAVLPHACDWRDALPMLASVELSARDGVLTLAATDRYTLGTYSIAWDGPDFDSAIVESRVNVPEPDGMRAVDQVKALQRLARGVPKTLRDLQSLTLEIGPDTVTARTFGAEDSVTETFALYTFGPFVKWRAILPTYGDDMPGIPAIAVSPVHMAKFSRVVSPSGDYAPLSLTFGASHLKPIQVTAGDYFRALIMPVRMPTE